MCTWSCTVIYVRISAWGVQSYYSPNPGLNKMMPAFYLCDEAFFQGSALASLSHLLPENINENMH